MITNHNVCTLVTHSNCETKWQTSDRRTRSTGCYF